MSEVYTSSGKKYQGEKGIISLTSWKARINTVSKTLYSLLQQCSGFHIVLVLSEEEFPQKEKELPENLMLFVENNFIELLWVYKNYRSFKKWIFTADKYKDVPIISADDDCIYTCNYAQELYDKWLENKNKCIIRYTPKKEYITQGPCTLYFLKSIDPSFLISKITNKDILKSQDDNVLSNKLKLLKYNLITLSNTHLPCKFHDNINPLTAGQEKCSFYNYSFT